MKEKISTYLFYRNYVIRHKDREATATKKKSIATLVEKLINYDVISFDIFDTLLFRLVNEPTDIFDLVGQQLNYYNFKEMRVVTEEKSRKQKVRDLGNREVTLEEIWKLIEEESGICQNLGIRTELELEKKMCFANPYLLEVLQILHSKGKKLIGISDMYLSREQISMLLKTCNVPNLFEELFVSSEHGVSKSDGNLYQIVKNRICHHRTYAHIGDNKHSDVRQAKKHGFTPYYYLR
jgi:predicted HAD superfamily hydrolase